MASVKEHFSKGIGYIKYDIKNLQEQRAELVEFIGYHDKLNTFTAYKRIAQAQADIESIDADIWDLKEQLAFYKDYFNYTQADIDKIPPATEESLQADWKRIEKERDDDTWTQEDHDKLMQKVHELDVSLGRIAT